MSPDEVFAEIRRLGAVSARVPFHGGNDEGLVESVELYDEADEIVDGPTRYGSEFEEALAQPVYDEFGGFDGELSVDGEIVWDTRDGSVRIRGEETVPAPFDRDVTPGPREG
jgi:hypothetical protein